MPISQGKCAGWEVATPAHQLRECWCTMLGMIRAVAVALLFSHTLLGASDEKRPSYPTFDYDVARAHEIKPHRRRIPTEGISGGFNQIHLILIVSAAGDVVDAQAGGDDKSLEFWPQLRGEV